MISFEKINKAAPLIGGLVGVGFVAEGIANAVTAYDKNENGEVKRSWAKTLGGVGMAGAGGVVTWAAYVASKGRISSLAR